MEEKFNETQLKQLKEEIEKGLVVQAHRYEEEFKMCKWFLIVACIICLGIGCIIGGAMVSASANKEMEALKEEYMISNLDPTEPIDCPFCGGEAEVHENSVLEDRAYVECKECGVSTDNYKGVTMEESKEQAIKAWNRRYQMLIAD